MMVEIGDGVIINSYKVTAITEDKNGKAVLHTDSGTFKSSLSYPQLSKVFKAIDINKTDLAY